MIINGENSGTRTESPVGWKRKRDEKIYRTHYYGTATVVLGEEKMNDPIGRAV